MTPLLIGALIGLALAFGYGFILVLMAMLGIPLTSRRGDEKRAAIAAAMQADAVEREAARQVAIRAAVARLEG